MATKVNLKLMPLINVKVSSSNLENKDELLKALSAELASLTGKPEKYIMSILDSNVPMTFSGSNDPCCYIEIKSIGALNPSAMTKSFCDIIEAQIGIPSDRIYISFEDVPASHWGFNRNTFG